MSEHRLLFVCTGNLCRSPMAEVIAQQVALEFGLEIETRSAGTHAPLDLPADRKTAAVCREVGLDLSAHRSARLTRELVDWSSRVAVMEQAHALAVRDLDEQIDEGRIVYLGPLAGEHQIYDPIGRFWLHPYRHARDLLFVAIRRMLSP